MMNIPGYRKYISDGWRGLVLKNCADKLPNLARLVDDGDVIVSYPDREVKRVRVGNEVFYIKIFRTSHPGMSLGKRLVCCLKACFRSLRCFHTLKITNTMLQMGFLCPETVLAACRSDKGEKTEIIINREITARTVGKLLAETSSQEEYERILRECASELRRFHDAGIIHGDCLPLNLCLDEDHRLVFLDNDRTKLMRGPWRRCRAERNLVQFAAHSWLNDTPHNLKMCRLFFSAYLGEKDAARLPALVRARYQRIAELAHEKQNRMLRSISTNIFIECMREAGEADGMLFWTARNSPLKDEELRQVVIHGLDEPGAVMMKENRHCRIGSVRTASCRVVVRKFIAPAGKAPFAPEEMKMHLAMRRLGLPAPDLYGYFCRKNSRSAVVDGIVVEYLSGSRILDAGDADIAAAMLAQLFALGFNHADFTRFNVMYNPSTGASTIISLTYGSLVGLRNIPSLLMQAQRYIESLELPLDHPCVQRFMDETYGCIGDLPFSRESFEAALRELMFRHRHRSERIKIKVPASVLKLLGGRWS